MQKWNAYFDLRSFRNRKASLVGGPYTGSYKHYHHLRYNFEAPVTHLLDDNSSDIVPRKYNGPVLHSQKLRDN